MTMPTAKSKTIEYFTRKGYKLAASPARGGLVFTTSNDGVLEIMSTTDHGVQTGVVTIDGQMNEALGEAMIQAIVAQLV